MSGKKNKYTKKLIKKYSVKGISGDIVKKYCKNCKTLDQIKDLEKVLDSFEDVGIDIVNKLSEK